MDLEDPILAAEGELTNANQANFLLAAFRVFKERNAVHNDLFLKSNVDEEMLHVRSKLKRAAALAEKGNGMTQAEFMTFQDSMLDLINYSVFCLRLAGLGQWKEEDDVL